MEDFINQNNEKCLYYNSISIPTANNNKINDDDNDFFVKKCLWMKGRIIISTCTVVIVLVLAVTYYSTNNISFIAGSNNNNNPLSITAAIDMVGSSSRKGVHGCNIASTTYIDAGGRTVDPTNPFQLCFQFGNTDSFCWSKSRSVHESWAFGWGTSWEGCYPCGWSAQIDNTHWHGTSERGNNNCGPACTEFCPPTTAHLTTGLV